MSQPDPIDQLFSGFPVLETERLRLRAITPEDAEAVFAIFSDEEVTRHYDLYTFEEMEEADDLIDFIAESYEVERQVRWAIARKEDDKLLGTCGFVWLREHRAEIGYDLARAYWGQGIMQEALGALLALAFERLELNRIEALVMPGNERSMALLARLGFVHEGTLREYDHFKGRFQDLEMYALLKRDWHPPV
jgi:ribosomal-protein-alanine N-acetyltransferase